MSNTTDRRAARSNTTLRADQLRPLNFPQLVTVELDDGGLPVLVTGPCISASLHPCTSETDEERVEGTENTGTKRAIESILETWRVDDEWWREPISRRYLEVILEGGKHLVLYEDLTGSGWYMQMP